MKRNAEANIDERLNASTKRIAQQNRRLAEELHMHVQETSVLQKDKKNLEEENRVLTRELDIKREAEQGYAKRGSKQAQELKDTQKKISSLEKSLLQTVEEIKIEKEAMTKKSVQEKKTLEQERESLKRLLELKTRELKNIRKLAREVLVQRSNIETFLISSLSLVRDQVKKDKGLPAIGTDKMPVMEKVDIADLSWEDRERVLRILFSKINSQAQQTSFTRLPEHSFDTLPSGLPNISRINNSREDVSSLAFSHGELAPLT